VERVQAFYKGRERETAHAQGSVPAPGRQCHFDMTKYDEAVAVYKVILPEWPISPRAPTLQEKIIKALERSRNPGSPAKEREVLGGRVQAREAIGSANHDNPEALAVGGAARRGRPALRRTSVHAAAQACKSKWQENKSDTRELEECLQTYRTAAEL